MQQERFSLGCEDDSVRQWGVPEGFLTEPIAHQQQFALHRVMDREGEHPRQVLDHLRSVPQIQMQQDLGVTGRRESRPIRRQLLSQLAEVVDLSVEGDGYLRVGGGHGLVRSGRVDDGKPSEPDRAPPIFGQVAALLVRPTMRQPPGHPHRQVKVSPAVTKDKLSRKPAHADIVMRSQSGLYRFLRPSAASPRNCLPSGAPTSTFRVGDRRLDLAFSSPTMICGESLTCAAGKAVRRARPWQV